ncbi:MAG TPA: hypothetical protein VHC20_01575 [Candidatus Paceibacterota bacterium]|nr:hypothetical protein [Candidatus Paceibacterota bacterium]
MPSKRNLADLDARAYRFARRSMSIAFFIGFVVSTTVSAGLVCERVRVGSACLAIVIDLCVLGVAAVAMVFTSRPLHVAFVDVDNPENAIRLRFAVLSIFQVLGAATGIALVHETLIHSGVDALRWMIESPPQLINDAVAVTGVLIAIRACASRQVRLNQMIQMLGILTVYGATRHLWHADHAPFPFKLSIQDLVVSQVLTAATGLVALRHVAFG